MNSLLKGLFFSLILAISFTTFTACSDDDSDNDGRVDNLTKIENFSVAVVQEQYTGNTYQYTWKAVKDAYSYQVFYRVKGSTGEWTTSNFYIPNPNTPGQTITRTMMASYGKGVVYEMKMVAHRDTQSTIIAESDTIESPALPLQ